MRPRGFHEQDATPHCLTFNLFPRIHCTYTTTVTSATHIISRDTTTAPLHLLHNHHLSTFLELIPFARFVLQQQGPPPPTVSSRDTRSDTCEYSRAPLLARSELTSLPRSISLCSRGSLGVLRLLPRGRTPGQSTSLHHRETATTPWHSSRVMNIKRSPASSTGSTASTKLPSSAARTWSTVVRPQGGHQHLQLPCSALPLYHLHTLDHPARRPTPLTTASLQHPRRRVFQLRRA